MRLLAGRDLVVLREEGVIGEPVALRAIEDAQANHASVWPRTGLVGQRSDPRSATARQSNSSPARIG